MTSFCAGGPADGDASLGRGSAYDGDVDNEHQENSSALSELGMARRNGRARRRRGRLAPSRGEMATTNATRTPSMTPPLAVRRHGSTVASSPVDSADDEAALEEEQQQQQQQQQQGEEASRIPRSVSFCEVVKEVLIDNRRQTYGNKASRRQHFYSKAELAIFKRAWYWDVMPREPLESLPSSAPAEEKQDYTRWTWEG